MQYLFQRLCSEEYVDETLQDPHGCLKPLSKVKEDKFSELSGVRARNPRHSLLLSLVLSRSQFYPLHQAVPNNGIIQRFCCDNQPVHPVQTVVSMINHFVVVITVRLELGLG